MFVTVLLFVLLFLEGKNFVSGQSKLGEYKIRLVNYT